MAFNTSHNWYVPAGGVTVVLHFGEEVPMACYGALKPVPNIGCGALSFQVASAILIPPPSWSRFTRHHTRGKVTVTAKFWQITVSLQLDPNADIIGSL